MIKTNKKFNIENKELGVLRAFLKQNELKVVVMGSYALYNIKNKDSYNDLQLVFNDIDIDLYKTILKELSNNLEDNIGRDTRIEKILRKNFNTIIEELLTYDNINSVDMHLEGGTLRKRSGNVDTFGGKIIFFIEGNDFSEKVKIDINFENKDFEIESHQIEIENEIYSASTYTYEKMLADKYIAFKKHYDNAKFELNVSRNSLGNIKKLWKDIYDITFIHNKVKSHDKVISYMESMVKSKRAESIRNMISIFIGKIIINHPNVLKTRNNWEDISKLILEFND